MTTKIVQSPLNHSDFFKDINDIEIPNPCVIIGKNGTGKSTLLDSIKNKSLFLKSNKKNIDTNEIEFLNSNDPRSTVLPKEEFAFGEFSFLNNSSFQDRLLKYPLHNMDLHKGKMREILIEAIKEKNIIIDEKEGLNINFYKQIIVECIANYFSNRRNNNNNSAISYINSNIDKIEQLQEIFFGDIENELREINRIRPAGKIFSSSYQNRLMQYRDLYIYNELVKQEENKGKKVKPASLSDDEFSLNYGHSPFLALNEVLETCGLNYQCEDIVGTDYKSNTNIRFKDKRSDKPINEDQLSSGERWLFALSTSLFNFNDDWRIQSYPKAVLLDEPDAFLHVEFIKSMMALLLTEFVQKRGIQVILTTHSPITVALADDDSILELTRDPKPQLIPRCREQALKILTDNVPNIEVSYKNSFQVIVEANEDAEFLNAAYQHYDVFRQKREQTSYRKEFDLQFIPAGNNKDGGCDHVKKLVDQFSENKFVLGLIDYDNQNKEEGSIYVLGLDNRYALEHYLYDPLLILAVLCEIKPEFTREFGVKDVAGTISPQSLLDMDHNHLKEAVLKLQKSILKEKITSEETVKYEYLSVPNIDIFKSWNNYNNKELSKKVINYFVEVQKIPDKTYFKRTVIGKIFPRHRQFISKDLSETFDRLEKHKR